jgi:hypothetical protein
MERGEARVNRGVGLRPDADRRHASGVGGVMIQPKPFAICGMSLDPKENVRSYRMFFFPSISRSKLETNLAAFCALTMNFLILHSSKIAKMQAVLPWAM